MLTGIAAPLPMINVDTDKIIPKQYLKTIRRTGLGRHLFDEMRHDVQGRRTPGVHPQPRPVAPGVHSR